MKIFTIALRRRNLATITTSGQVGAWPVRASDGSAVGGSACYCLRREEAPPHRPRGRRCGLREEEARRGQGRAGPLGRGDGRRQAQLSFSLSAPRGLGATGSAPALQAGG